MMMHLATVPHWLADNTRSRFSWESPKSSQIGESRSPILTSLLPVLRHAILYCASISSAQASNTASSFALPAPNGFPASPINLINLPTLESAGSTLAINASNKVVNRFSCLTTSLVVRERQDTMPLLLLGLLV